MNADPKHTILRERGYNEFVVRFQYVNPEPNNYKSDYEPAIVLARPRRAGVRSAWIIMLGASWKYVDDPQKGGHSDYMVDATVKIADMLKLSQDPQSRFKIAEAILENLEELINMPPWALVQDDFTGSMLSAGGEHKLEVVH